MALLTDRSGVCSGVSQTALPFNAKRQYLLIQNIGGADMWINIGLPAVANSNSIKLTPNSSWEASLPNYVPADLITILGTLADPYMAKEL